VASPDAAILVDSVGSSALATGGMGDVLSGVVGAFLARGVEPREAGALGLFTSGRAARLAGGGVGLLPTDIVLHLPDALAEEGDGETELAVPGLLFDQDPAS
jgi:NAD(P)H-hydrate epimerase